MHVLCPVPMDIPQYVPGSGSINSSMEIYDFTIDQT